MFCSIETYLFDKYSINLKLKIIAIKLTKSHLQISQFNKIDEKKINYHEL